jgi:hypothetical protein
MTYMFDAKQCVALTRKGGQMVSLAASGGLGLGLGPSAR